MRPETTTYRILVTLAAVHCLEREPIVMSLVLQPNHHQVVRSMLRYLQSVSMVHFSNEISTCIQTSTGSRHPSSDRNANGFRKNVMLAVDVEAQMAVNF